MVPRLGVGCVKVVEISRLLTSHSRSKTYGMLIQRTFTSVGAILSVKISSWRTTDILVNGTLHILIRNSIITIKIFIESIAQAELQGDQSSNCIVTGDLLGDDYVFAQMHFHWASDNNGSEHTVNGKKLVLIQGF